MTLWSHTLVKNEERYIWFALRSIVDHVDKMLVWDTGSSDNTVHIIKEFKKRFPNKVMFKEIGDVDANEFTKVRQQMLEETKSDWFIIVDGDEVWWKDSIKQVREIIEKDGEKLESLVSYYYNVVGDIFHYQDESAGKYNIDGKIGHLSVRAMNRKIPGLHLEKPHGTQGFFDDNNKLVQERVKKKRKHIGKNYLHFTHMIRSTNLDQDQKVIKRSIKYKYELGNPFPKDFYYPEVFFLEKPEMVPTPWETLNNKYLIKSITIQIPRNLKRNLWKGRSGY